MRERPDRETSLSADMVQQALGASDVRTVSASGKNIIDGELMGHAWAGSSLTYAFPDSPDDYAYGPEKDDNFAPASTSMQDAAKYFLDTAFGSKANDGFSVEGFTGLTVSEGTDTDATLRYAQSSDPDPSAYANYPLGTEASGDTWYGTTADFTMPTQGDWKFKTFAHETGHALGLKHGHILQYGFPRLEAQYDSQEYSVMTYRSYPGQKDLDIYIEQQGYPQTFMMADIAALQYLYGANFTVNSKSTVYSWKPDSGDTWVNGKVGISNIENVIFATIWDGGGRHDTYDLSAYSDNVNVDLRPGKYSVFSADQLSDLDYYRDTGAHIARGSIFNALLYQGDTRSLIEDAVGGSGSDILTGNQGNNHLSGNAGEDKLYGLKGNDVHTGGDGNDTFYFSAGGDHDKITDFITRHDRIDLHSYHFTAIRDIKALETDGETGLKIDLGHGDSLLLEGIHAGDLHHNRDFIL